MMYVTENQKHVGGKRETIGNKQRNFQKAYNGKKRSRGPVAVGGRPWEKHVDRKFEKGEPSEKKGRKALSWRKEKINGKGQGEGSGQKKRRSKAKTNWVP